MTAVLLKQVFWIVIVLTSLSNFSLILPKKGPKFPLKCLRECHTNLSGDEIGHWDTLYTTLPSINAENVVSHPVYARFLNQS